MEIDYKKSFPNFKLECKVEIPDQGITVLFGPSGSGKSTLLNCIAGLELADHARFKLNGQLVDDSRLGIRLAVHMRRIGYVFQDNCLFPHMSVRDNLLYGYRRKKPIKQVVHFETVVDSFSLQDLLSMYPSQLSGGQKQRVALGRALLCQPQLLILDEPMSALDNASKRDLYPFLEKIHSLLTIPVIYVSHNIREILRLGDHLVLMRDGSVIACGDLVELCVTQPILTEHEGISFILQGIVNAVDRDQHISSVDCDGVNVMVSGTLLEVDQDVRILVHAKDVSLSLSQSTDSSILNILPVTVDKVNSQCDGKHLVECRLGNTRILSLISIRSLQKLEICQGLKLFAQFKATALVR